MKIITNIILFITSILLGVLLYIPSLLHVIIDIVRYKSINRRVNYYFLNTAVSVDILCNAAFSNMLNAWFLKKGGYHFGTKGETVSSVLGKNQYDDKLTWVGVGLSGILDLIDKNHCYKSIDNDEYYIKYPEVINKNNYKYSVLTFAILVLILYSCLKLVLLLYNIIN